MVLPIWHFVDLFIRHSACFYLMIPLKGAQPRNVQLDFELFLLIMNFNSNQCFISIPMHRSRSSLPADTQFI
jgi:hypothetical protein